MDRTWEQAQANTWEGLLKDRWNVPDYIEVLNSAGKTAAFLLPSTDGLKECWIDNELNGICSLTFQMPATSAKWQYITDAYEFVAGGKRFILLKPDTEEIVRDGEKVWGKVTAQEKWTELDRDYVTISNDSNSPGPAWSAVIIVSGGTPYTGYTAGSAGSALAYLLDGSGWTLDTCDVTGTFDLETEKASLLANIHKVQELWGGYLVWDSENKTVSLRSESTWQNYNGFQVRYAKNLKGITRTVNRDLVTRLYPFGKEDLNIGQVNGGVIYLDNNSYSDKVYIGKYENQDITVAAELKTKALAELAKKCKPRYSYKISMLDLSIKPQWAHETFLLGDIADVVDADLNTDEHLRIIRHKYNVFQPWKCELDIGEPLEKLSSRISDVSSVTDTVISNTGTANILKGIINTRATRINGASGDYTMVDGVSTWFGTTGGVRNGKVTRITPNGLVISNDGAQTFDLAIDGEGIYADKLIVSDVYAIASGDSYTKMGSAGISVMDAQGTTKAFLGQYESGKFGLKLVDGDIQITGSKSKTILNHFQGFKIQKLIDSEWQDQFYVDGDGNVKFKGKLDGASGTFGTITLGDLQGTKSQWKLGTGTFRLGNSDTDYKMLFDGTNLLFSNDVKIQFKGDTGATGATGAQGEPGSYYAPYYLQSTYIGSTEIQSPAITGNNGRFSGELAVGSGNNLAGINGVGTDPTSIRFWSGSSDKTSAPFRVNQAGKFIATDGDVTGAMKVVVGNNIQAQLVDVGSTIGGALLLHDNYGTQKGALFYFDGPNYLSLVSLVTGVGLNFLDSSDKAQLSGALDVTELLQVGSPSYNGKMSLNCSAVGSSWDAIISGTLWANMVGINQLKLWSSNNSYYRILRVNDSTGQLQQSPDNVNWTNI